MSAFEQYALDGFYDELLTPEGRPRAGTEGLLQAIAGLGVSELRRRQLLAEASLLRKGITFNVYGSADGAEKIFPFDVLPRVVEAAE